MDTHKESQTKIAFGRSQTNKSALGRPDSNKKTSNSHSNNRPNKMTSTKNIPSKNEFDEQTHKEDNSTLPNKEQLLLSEDKLSDQQQNVSKPQSTNVLDFTLKPNSFLEPSEGRHAVRSCRKYNCVESDDRLKEASNQYNRLSNIIAKQALRIEYLEAQLGLIRQEKQKHKRSSRQSTEAQSNSHETKDEAIQESQFLRANNQELYSLVKRLQTQREWGKQALAAKEKSNEKLTNQCNDLLQENKFLKKENLRLLSATAQFLEKGEREIEIISKLQRVLALRHRCKETSRYKESTESQSRYNSTTKCSRVINSEKKQINSSLANSPTWSIQKSAS